MVTDESVLFCTTASTGGSGGCFLAARAERVMSIEESLWERSVSFLFFFNLGFTFSVGDHSYQSR